jgi:hypothetical protein
MQLDMGTIRPVLYVTSEIQQPILEVLRSLGTTYKQAKREGTDVDVGSIYVLLVSLLKLYEFGNQFCEALQVRVQRKIVCSLPSQSSAAIHCIPLQSAAFRCIPECKLAPMLQLCGCWCVHTFIDCWPLLCTFTGRWPLCTFTGLCGDVGVGELHTHARNRMYVNTHRSARAHTGPLVRTLIRTRARRSACAHTTHVLRSCCCLNSSTEQLWSPQKRASSTMLHTIGR